MRIALVRPQIGEEIAFCVLKENLIEGVKIDGASVVEHGVARVQTPAEMQRRAVLVVVAKLDESLPERVEVAQGIHGRLLRAEILHCGKILAGASNVRDKVRISDE